MRQLGKFFLLFLASLAQDDILAPPGQGTPKVPFANEDAIKMTEALTYRTMNAAELFLLPSMANYYDPNQGVDYLYEGSVGPDDEGNHKINEVGGDLGEHYVSSTALKSSGASPTDEHFEEQARISSTASVGVSLFLPVDGDIGNQSEGMPSGDTGGISQDGSLEEGDQAGSTTEAFPTVSSDDLATLDGGELEGTNSGTRMPPPPPTAVNVTSNPGAVDGPGAIVIPYEKFAVPGTNGVSDTIGETEEFSPIDIRADIGATTTLEEDDLGMVEASISSAMSPTVLAIANDDLSAGEEPSDIVRIVLDPVGSTEEPFAAIPVTSRPITTSTEAPVEPSIDYETTEQVPSVPVVSLNASETVRIFDSESTTVQPVAMESLAPTSDLVGPVGQDYSSPLDPTSDVFPSHLPMMVTPAAPSNQPVPSSDPVIAGSQFLDRRQSGRPRSNVQTNFTRMTANLADELGMHKQYHKWKRAAGKVLRRCQRTRSADCAVEVPLIYRTIEAYDHNPTKHHAM